MKQVEITLLDWAVLVGYFAVIAGIGVYVARKVKTTGHYFMGGRGFGKWLMMGQSFGVGTHAEMPVALAGAVYSTGFSAIWFQWKNLFITPFYWIMAPLFRRFRRSSMTEVFDDRYGVWMGVLYTFFAIAYFTINMGSMLVGAGKVISQAAGGGVGVNEIVIGMTVIFVLYSFFGGLISVAWTDFFQGFLIIILSFMLIPLGWKTVGGMAGMRESLEAYKFTLAAPQGVTPWVILMLTVNGLVGIMVQPHQLATVGSGKDERSCRQGMAYGNFIKRFCTIGWALVGLITAAMVAKGIFPGGALKDPEDAFGFACHHLLFPGALGLLIACVLAANMSTCSAFMVDSGALFVEGLYRKYIKPGRPDGHYLLWGRLSGLLITVLGILYALYLVDRVLYTFLLTETLATYMGVSLLGGLLWRRANRWGSLASIAAAMAVNFSLYAAQGKRFDAWDPNVFLVSLISGIAALVVVSLLTPPERKEKTDEFFSRLNTSTDADASGGESPEATASRGQALLVPNLLHPVAGAAGHGFWRAYREDFSGLVKTWGVVAALVALAWGLLKM